MTKKIVFKMSIVCIFCVALLGASGAAFAVEELKIGLLAPLSGPVSFAGKTMEAGTIMAIDKVNAGGGITIGGKKYKIKLVSLDTKYTAAGGRTGAERLMFEEKVKFIIGSTSLDTMAFRGITEENKVMIFPVGGAIFPDPKFPYTFRATSLVDVRYVDLYEYTKKNHPGVKTTALFNPDTPVGGAFEKMGRMAAEANGLEVVSTERVAAGTSDFYPQLTKVLASKVDIIDLGGNAGGKNSGLIIKQARELGFKGLFISSVSLLSDALLEIASAEDLNGIVDNSFVSEDPILNPEFRKVVEDYKKRFSTPFNSLVTDLYDVVVGLLSFLDGQDTLDTSVLRDQFADYTWEGINGKLSWGGKERFGIKRAIVHADFFSVWENGKPKIVEVSMPRMK